MLNIKTLKYTDFWRSVGVCALNDGLLYIRSIQFLKKVNIYNNPYSRYVELLMFCVLICDIYFDSFLTQLSCNENWVCAIGWCPSAVS